jgi:hypothetical protein
MRQAIAVIMMQIVIPMVTRLITLEKTLSGTFAIFQNVLSQLISARVGIE